MSGNCCATMRTKAAIQRGRRPIDGSSKSAAGNEGGTSKMTRCIWRRTAILALSAIGALVARPASAETAIGVSYQPALYWSVPYFIATEKGWWKELGLAPNFTTFPAGAPQIA